MNGNEMPGRAERKKLRKRIRKRMIWHSLWGFARDACQYLFDNYLFVLFWRKRLNRLLKITRDAVSAIVLRDGVVTDCTPECLSEIDQSILQWREEITRGVDVPSRRVELGIVIGLGSHLGEVVIRSIGGRWVFPPRTRLWAGHIHRDMSLFYDLWYVDSLGRRIYALKIAGLFWEGNHNAPSLAEAYRQISGSALVSSDQPTEVPGLDENF